MQNGLAEEVEGWSEAERRGAATVAEWASRRSEAEGLDRSATLGAEKRHAREGWHRSVSGVSFRRGVLSRMSQDKPMQRARSYECVGLLSWRYALLCPAFGNKIVRRFSDHGAHTTCPIVHTNFY